MASTNPAPGLEYVAPAAGFQTGLNTMEFYYYSREMWKEFSDKKIYLTTPYEQWLETLPRYTMQYMGVSLLETQGADTALTLCTQTVLEPDGRKVRLVSFTPGTTGWYHLTGRWMDIGGNFHVYAIDSRGHCIGYALASNHVNVAMKASETYYFAVNDIEYRAGLTITKTDNPPFHNTNMIRMRQNSTGNYTHLPHNGQYYLGLRYEVEGSSVEVSGDPTDRYAYGQTEQLTVKAVGLGDSVIRFYGADDVLLYTVNLRVEQLWWQRLFSFFGIPVPHTWYLINPGDRKLIF